MPRVNRVIAPGLPHHVTQRGNHRDRVFFRDEDRKLYLSLISEFLPHYGIALEAYCLMSNHVHLVVTPHDQKGLSRALQRVHSDYSRAVHLRLRQNGHLWQARFHSAALDEEHFWTTLVYVEQNPVRAGMVSDAEQWRWSSARAHLGLTAPGILNTVRWKARFDAARWKQCLSLGLVDAALANRIREATRSGFPLGDSAFCEQLGERLGVQTKPGKRGRPAKATKINSQAVQSAA